MASLIEKLLKFFILQRPLLEEKNILRTSNCVDANHAGLLEVVKLLCEYSISFIFYNQ